MVAEISKYLVERFESSDAWLKQVIFKLKLEQKIVYGRDKTCFLFCNRIRSVTTKGIHIYDTLNGSS